ncbi:MAG: hypothetical protein JKP98_10350 [Rhodobacteraceae bacterium]|nr:hypothetical protein [Paracoccaceae bacterium]
MTSDAVLRGAVALQSTAPLAVTLGGGGAPGTGVLTSGQISLFSDSAFVTLEPGTITASDGSRARRSAPGAEPGRTRPHNGDHGCCRCHHQPSAPPGLEGIGRRRRGARFPPASLRQRVNGLHRRGIGVAAGTRNQIAGPDP